MDKRTTNTLMIVAIIAVAIAAINVVITLVNVGNLTKAVGYASSEQGNATLQVVGVASLNFTIRNIK